VPKKYFFLILFFVSLNISAEELSVPLHKFGPDGLSKWHSFEIQEDTPSFLIEVFGTNDTNYQVIDLIDPNGITLVNSSLMSNVYTGYELPVLKNITSTNRSHSTINKHSALLVPNFYSSQNVAHGTWKFRIFAKQYFPEDVVEIKIISTRIKSKTRVLNIQLHIEKNSYWDQNRVVIDEMIAVAKKIYALHDIELSITQSDFESSISNYDVPADIAKLVEEKLEKKFENSTPSLKLLLIGRIKEQSKPINGISCLAGLYSTSNCFASMFADPLLAQTVTSSQAGKILAHEVGHYLGLFHTVDEGYMYIGTIFDPLEDTDKVVTGKNMMDPGIHNEHPTFTQQQIHVLKKHPLVLEK
jgi:hypothetical protein